jgi:hypothetical protein
MMMWLVPLVMVLSAFLASDSLISDESVDFLSRVTCEADSIIHIGKMMAGSRDLQLNMNNEL